MTTTASSKRLRRSTRYALLTSSRDLKVLKRAVSPTFPPVVEEQCAKTAATLLGGSAIPQLCPAAATRATPAALQAARNSVVGYVRQGCLRGLVCLVVLLAKSRSDTHLISKVAI
jgi:hypothetical protein